VGTAAVGPAVVVQTSGDGLRFYWNQYGTTTWHLQAIRGPYAIGPPAITTDTDG
jgi:hypothetical protein